MTSLPAHTPLYAWHASHGGRLVDFAGWEMPIQYTSIVAEHLATRTAAGVFDVSHMGRLRFDGAGAARFLDRIVTRPVLGMASGHVRYAMVTNAQGGILDDVLVYRLTDLRTSDDYYQMVVNASNRAKILDWLNQHGVSQACQLTDTTTSSAMIAVQGPRAADLLASWLGNAPKQLKYYGAQEVWLAGEPAILSRTGYTGEDGWELVVPAASAIEVWQRLVEVGQTLGGLAAGLGARDTLRLEAAMPLYGHELTESINPYQAGLSFAVELEGRTFTGCEALAKARDDSERLVRVGWQLESKRVPREGFDVLAEGRVVGQVTSGTFSPTLERPIAMGYCESRYGRPGQAVEIDVRGRREPGQVVSLPFYRRRPVAAAKK